MSDEYLTQDERRSRKIRSISLWIIGVIVIVGGVWGVFKLAANSNQQLANNPGGIQAVTAADHKLGSDSAKVKIIEYADFQCPACANAAPNLTQLVKDYPNQVQVIYRPFPLESIHPTAAISAQAAEAAGKQGKYWEMHDLLFQNQTVWENQPTARDMFASYAQQIGLNVDQFRKDMDSQEIQNLVASEYQQDLNMRLDHTPTMFIDGKEITTPSNYQGYKSLVESFLK